DFVVTVQSMPRDEPPLERAKIVKHFDRLPEGLAGRALAAVLDERRFKTFLECCQQRPNGTAWLELRHLPHLLASWPEHTSEYLEAMVQAYVRLDPVERSTFLVALKQKGAKDVIKACLQQDDAPR